jgi:hypothetical protein
VADLYFRAGVIHQPVDVTTAFDRSVYNSSANHPP